MKRCLVVAIGLVLLSVGVPDAFAGDLRAGAAASNITPPLGTPIVGGWKPIPARHIHDELFARCLVLDDGTTQLAIVMSDNVGIPREVYDRARDQIAAETQLDADHILMAATHTHSAGTARGPNRLLPAEELTEYQSFLATRIADGVRRAANNLEPAQIAWGTTAEPSQVFNRRWHTTNENDRRNPFGGVDQVRMNPPRGSTALVRPAGPTDPEIAFLSVQSRDGRPISLLANYSLHYVGGVRSGDVSADYFGMFADRIQELLDADRLNPPFVGMLSNGTSGDINNIDFSKKSERRQPYEKMREVAFQVAQRVADAHAELEFRSDITLAAETAELELTLRKPNDELLAYLEVVASRPEGEEPYHSREKIYVDRVRRLHAGPDTVTVLLQALRIGDVGIAAIPFETFVETGLHLKEESPFSPTFTIELANGSYGYLPTPEQHELGGYETWMGTNIVEFHASDKIEQTILGLFDAIKDSQ